MNLPTVQFDVRTSRKKGGGFLSEVRLPHPLTTVLKDSGFDVEIGRVRVKTTSHGDQWITSFRVGRNWLDIALFEVDKKMIGKELSLLVRDSVRSVQWS